MLLLGALAPAGAQASDDRIIPEGVSSAGVDLGLLTVDEATAKLEGDAALRAALARPVVLGAAGIRWTLTAAEAGLRLDARRTAERAAAVPTPSPAPDSPEGGTPVGVSVPPALSHSRAAVRAFVARVARGTWRAPRSARLRMTLRHMLVRRSKGGFRLNKPQELTMPRMKVVQVEKPCKHAIELDFKRILFLESEANLAHSRGQCTLV